MNQTKTGGEAAGLVHSSTSVTGNFPTGTIKLDRTLSRNRRKKCGTITAARLIQEQMQAGGHRYKVAMVTLTYALVDSWRPQHISGFLRVCRQHLLRRGFKCRYTWVAELQQRGAVHYHILIWLPKGLSLPKPDKAGWWRHGFTEIAWAKNAVGYIAKYAGKKEDVERLPRGLRICGSGGLDKSRAMERRWWLSPGWVRQNFKIEDDARPAVGGGYVSRVTGEWMPSPWLVIFVNGVLSLMRKQDNETSDTSFSGSRERSSYERAQADRVRASWQALPGTA